MNKVNVKKLLDAMRSGEYMKGRGQLRLGDRYCAAGVAAAEYIKEFPDYKWVEEDVGDFAFIGPEASNRMFCPSQVQQWLGLDEDEIDTIVNINDDNDTFEPVCKYVEEMLNAE